MAEEIRTRIAPSPTGPLHIGTARTALFNYLFARKNEGKFILRIEDTDSERSTEEHKLDIENALAWLGLDWDEGPETPDEYGPYLQSLRGDIYKKYAKQLLDDEKAYNCYCTVEELDAERKKQEQNHEAPKYSGKCRSLTKEQIDKYKAEGRKPAVRFKISETDKIKFNDLIHGKVGFDPQLIGDFIIVKPNGQPIFTFCSAVDDAEMKITHVIRGDDHLSNTPKQIMLLDALNLAVPEYGHLPMILNSDRTKMSKRKNPVSVTKDFQDKGYLPEAMINFMAFLSWTPARQGNSTGIEDESEGEVDNEFFTLDELIKEFDISNVGKSAAIFDVEKLNFYNGYYIRKMPLGELTKRCLPYLMQAGIVEKESEMVLKAVGLVQERLKYLSEVVELCDYFFTKPKYEAELLVAKKSTKEETKKALEEAHKYLEEEKDFGRDSTEQLLRALAAKMNLGAGVILWPIRVALTGKVASPGVFELIDVMGKEETLERIKVAIDML